MVVHALAAVRIQDLGTEPVLQPLQVFLARRLAQPAGRFRIAGMFEVVRGELVQQGVQGH